MKLPRDLDGEELASLLRRYGYEITRQTVSHVRLASTAKVTVPRYKELRVGTLNAILSDVAAYLEIDGNQLARDLFKR